VDLQRRGEGRWVSNFDALHGAWRSSGGEVTKAVFALFEEQKLIMSALRTIKRDTCPLPPFLASIDSKQIPRVNPKPEDPQLFSEKFKTLDHRVRTRPKTNNLHGTVQVHFYVTAIIID
jgi:hypothetical protein